MVYNTTKCFPKEELFGLTSQMKRSAVSITSNIAEGTGRQYKKDTLQFLHIARGSAYELESLFHVALAIGLLTVEVAQILLNKINDVLKLLNGLIKYTQKADLK